jgi:hypothetical protein
MVARLLCKPAGWGTGARIFTSLHPAVSQFSVSITSEASVGDVVLSRAPRKPQGTSQAADVSLVMLSR